MISEESSTVPYEPCGLHLLGQMVLGTYLIALLNAKDEYGAHSKPAVCKQ
jgi:hypothetical protein